MGERQNIRDLLVYKLAKVPCKSTRHMPASERESGIRQMLDELDSLAAIDGCVAAAWASEIIEALANWELR